MNLYKELIDSVMEPRKAKEFFFISDMSTAEVEVFLLDKKLEKYFLEDIVRIKNYMELIKNVHDRNSYDVFKLYQEQFNNKSDELNIEKRVIPNFPIQTTHFPETIVNEDSFKVHKEDNYQFLSSKFSTYLNYNLASGRNIHLWNVELKGCGRTYMVESFDYANSNGEISVKDALQEYVKYRVLEKIGYEAINPVIGILRYKFESGYRFILIRLNHDLKLSQLSPWTSSSKKIISKMLEDENQEPTQWLDKIIFNLAFFTFQGFTHEYLSHDSITLNGNLIDLDGLHIGERGELPSILISFESSLSLDKSTKIEDLKEILSTDTSAKGFYSSLHRVLNVCIIFSNYLKADPNHSGIPSQVEIIKTFFEFLEKMYDLNEGLSSKQRKHLAQLERWILSSPNGDEGLKKCTRETLKEYMSFAEDDISIQSNFSARLGNTNIHKCILTSKTNQNQKEYQRKISKLISKIVMLADSNLGQIDQLEESLEKELKAFSSLTCFKLEKDRKIKMVK